MRVLSSLPLLLLAGSQLVSCAPQADSGSGPSTGLPLTVSFTIDPSPTLTDAAVASAYSTYADDCGAKLAQTKQDLLAQYNFDNSLSVDVEDADFLQTVAQDPEFQRANAICLVASNNFQKEKLLITDVTSTSDTDTAASTSDTAAPTSDTAAPTSNSATSASNTSGASSAPSSSVKSTSASSTKPTSSATRSSSSASSTPTGGAAGRAPVMLLVLAGVLAPHLLP
ncbi:hypothetical protein DFH09DRAFT_1468235 [Mycena vulgaris]|nr:hypothetical protein DFH09DRAFT_1468235 [Mycena vulgaris]